MDKFIDGISAAANSGNLDSIVVYGYASPDGPFRNNDRLSTQRCHVVADYISRQAGIPLNDIHTAPGVVAWEGLRTLVIGNAHTPSRDAVLRILDKYIPAACTDNTLSDQCRQSLMAIDNGRTYKWLLDNLFPQLRCALAVYTYTTPDNPTVYPPLESIECNPYQVFTKEIAVIPPPPL